MQCANLMRELTPQRIRLRERIAELWSAGLTASQIAERVGSTRNVVLGLRWRMGLPERDNPGGKPRIEPLRPTLDPFPPRGRCVYPLGDPQAADFRFCGGRATAGDPYCAEHHGICYRPFVARPLSPLAAFLTARSAG